MILISLAYILEYALNEKYSIENFSVFNFSRDGNEEIRLNDDIELNPYLDINITFSEGFLYDFLAIHTNFFNGVTKEILEEKFFMQGEYPIYYYNFKERVNFTDFTISFKCWDDSNCTLFSDFLYLFGDRPIGFFYFYNPGMIDHTEDPPIQKKNDKSNFFIYYLYPPGESGLKEWNFDWEVIKYKDKSSLIDSLTNNKREYYSGHAKNEEKSNENIITYYSNLNYIKYDEKIGYYIDFLRLVFENSHGEYLLYKRTKKEFMDVIANIGALFSTVKFVL